MPKKKDYQPKEIEEKWSKYWIENKIGSAEFPSKKKKMHVLDMFPYPSGEGLHAGHCKIFTASDAYARYKRMQGYNVLHATGWDAFGLPAEQFAIKNKVNPNISTKKNIDNFRRQMKMMGFSYDWDREINTTDPEFYKWTQWIFLKMYERGLAYETFEPINWCPTCKTGLANEDLEGNTCERCGTVVEKKPLRQWSIRITDYAEKLLKGVDGLDWRENIKDLQRNWIGKSEGSEIDFKLRAEDIENVFTVFTTRADTLFGCTYCVFAPEHKLIREYLDNGLIQNKTEVEKYIEEVKNKTEIERISLGKEKTGIKLEGVVAINPANQKEVPVFVADYVLATYGTGAIMAVPAHDERDYEFAKKNNIEIKNVIYPIGYNPETQLYENGEIAYEHSDINLLNQILSGERVYSGKGRLRNSEKFDGMKNEEAKKKITEFVGGKLVSKYKLRDWVFARQRYWGEPFPLVHVGEGQERKTYTVDEEDLPVVLPMVENYEPTGTGESPLANIDSWVNIRGYITEKNTFKVIQKENEPEFIKNNPNIKIVDAKRETNTMPQWAGSSWYWLRYMDPDNKKRFVGEEEEKYWGEVDVYLGGLEHATRHLIYGRFWHQFLYDCGYLSTPEPFRRLEGVGLVLAENGSKMSKRSGNVVNPDEIVDRFGADTMRLYLMFMGPYHDSVSWNEKNILGPRRFLERVWAMQYIVNNEFVDNREVIKELHKTIKKVTEDNEKLSFNTSISQLMILLNKIEKENVYEGGLKGVSYHTYLTFLKLLAPFAPFMTEEIVSNFGNSGLDTKSIHNSSWPSYDETLIVDESVTMAIQISGKLRGLMKVARDLPDEEVIKLVKEQDVYKKWVGEVVPKKIIVVKNKLINIVI